MSARPVKPAAASTVVRHGRACHRSTRTGHISGRHGDEGAAIHDQADAGYAALLHLDQAVRNALLYHAHQVCDRFIVMSHGTKVCDVTKAETSIPELTEYVVRT